MRINNVERCSNLVYSLYLYYVALYKLLKQLIVFYSVFSNPVLCYFYHFKHDSY